MPVIDADAHVHECDHTWDFFEGSDRQFKPMIVRETDGKDPDRTYWIVDGTLGRRPEFNVGKATPREYRELEDVPGRLRHMDELGVDIQVLYPSILTTAADRPEVEGALWRSYNRWMADACERANGRLRWVCRVPLTSMEDACTELRWAKDHGACGVFLRSLEGERMLCDPFFFPLYKETSELDLPVCVHVSIGNRRMFDFLSQPPDGGAFLKFKVGVISACHTILMSGVPEQFPKLRWGFVEASSDWVPYVIRELRKRFEHRGQTLEGNPLRDNRIFVTCQIDDDLPHVLEYAGEDTLIIGTDYGHADTATQLYAMKELQKREDIEPRILHKIVDDNARALYGL